MKTRTVARAAVLACCLLTLAGERAWLKGYLAEGDSGNERFGAGCLVFATALLFIAGTTAAWTRRKAVAVAAGLVMGLALASLGLAYVMLVRW